MDKKLAKKNRDQAILEGKKTYIGSSACKHCGSYEKYVTTYSCYHCNHKKGVERLRAGCCEGIMTKEKWAKNRERRREKIRENNRRYQQTERGKVVHSAKSARRRASVRDQTPELTKEEIQEILSIYEECGRISKETGIPHEVDHITPICKGGLHHPSNLQILTMEENRKKGGK